MLAEVHAMSYAKDYYYSNLTNLLEKKKTSIEVDHPNLMAHSLMRRKSVVM